MIRATRKPMLIAFRATRKLMLWYLEQPENPCFVFRATRKSMLKVIRATRKSTLQFQGPIFWKLGIGAKFPNQTGKNMDASLINTLIWSIFWNKNISCHNTLKLSLFSFGEEPANPLRQRHTNCKCKSFGSPV